LGLKLVPAEPFQFFNQGFFHGSKMAAVGVGVWESGFIVGFFPSAGFTASSAQRVSLVEVHQERSTFRAVEISVDVCVGPHDLPCYFWLLSL
jgi:hypothetical protein